VWVGLGVGCGVGDVWKVGGGWGGGGGFWCGWGGGFSVGGWGGVGWGGGGGGGVGLNERALALQERVPFKSGGGETGAKLAGNRKFPGKKGWAHKFDLGKALKGELTTLREGGVKLCLAAAGT